MTLDVLTAVGDALHTHVPADPLAGLGDAYVVHGDAHQIPLPDDSVDLIVTSPPYFGLRSYTDGGEHYDGQIGAEPTHREFVDALLAVTREAMRVLKPYGSLWVNLGDKYARTGGVDRKDRGSHLGDPGGRAAPRRAQRGVDGVADKSLIGIPWRYALRCVDDLGLILRQDVVWSKPNGMPESVTDRCRRSHEQWFHFTLEPRYYANMDPLRVPHTSTPQRRTGRKADRTGRGQGHPPQTFSTAARDEPAVDGHPLGGLPRSVWTIPTEPLIIPDHLDVAHYAAFPIEWPRRIITGWAPADGVVLDVFGGTGTTALAARALGLTGISLDLSHDYCRIAQWRLTESGHEYRARGVKPPTARHTPPPDHATLDFGGPA